MKLLSKPSHRYVAAFLAAVVIIVGGYLFNQKETAFSPGAPVSVSLSQKQNPPYRITDGAYHILTVEAKQQRKYFAQNKGESHNQPYGVTSFLAATAQAGYRVAAVPNQLDSVILYRRDNPMEAWVFNASGAIGKISTDETVQKLPDVDPVEMFAASPFTYSAEFSGESAGLAVGLAWLDVLNAGDQSRGLKVYATGALATNGEVIAVENTSLKIQSALSEKADLVLVPKGAEMTAEQKKSGKVVEVESLTEAAEVLAKWRKS